MPYKISIVVISYNQQKYIKRCIDSLLTQTYTNLEIIIVDDASKDKTKEICIEYQKRDKRIRYIRHKTNMGYANAKNTGIDMATGDYISFVNSCDYVTRDYCDVLYKNLIYTQSDISICNFKEVENEQQETENRIRIYKGREKYYKIWGKLGKRQYNRWARLYKREIFINLRYLPNASCEDVNIIHKILAKAKRVVYTDKQLYIAQRKEHNLGSQSIINLLDGEYDRITFFRDVLGDKKLTSIADTSFFVHVIESFHVIDKDVMLTRYKNIGATLDSFLKLDGNKVRYKEDFGEFVKLNIPLNCVYKKIEDIDSSANISITWDEGYMLKISYDIHKDDKISIVRLFLLDDISNWSGKNGINIKLRAHDVQSDLFFVMADVNDVIWRKQLSTKERNINIEFSGMRSLDLTRVKYIAFQLEGKREREISTIHIERIAVLE